MESNLIKFYLIFCLLVGLQRLWELRLSRRNETWLKQNGAVEYGAKHFIWMKLTHIIWLMTCPLYVLIIRPAISYQSFIFFMCIFLIGQVLRTLAIRKLGRRWSVKIFVLSDCKPVDGGIFRYIRHPNYLGVILEIFALPAMVGAIWPAIILSILNGMVLIIRIKFEERALSKHNDYQKYFGYRKRFRPIGTSNNE